MPQQGTEADALQSGLVASQSPAGSHTSWPGSEGDTAPGSGPAAEPDPAVDPEAVSELDPAAESSPPDQPGPVHVHDDDEASAPSAPPSAQRTEDAAAAIPHAENAQQGTDPAAAIPGSFIDVSPNHVHFPGIDWMRRSGLAAGVPTEQGTVFRPGGVLNRGAMAAFLFRMDASASYRAPAVSPFIDVPVTHRFYRAISWMHATGLAVGVQTGAGLEYRPESALSRGAMAAFLYRRAAPQGFTPPAASGFLDVPRSHTFYTPITWMSRNGFGVGVCTPRGKEFLADGALLRGAMATMLMRITNGSGSPAISCAKPNLLSPVSTTVVVNKRRPVIPWNWEPSDLRWPNVPNVNGQPLRAEAAGALEQMYAGASAAGVPFTILSAYRSFWTQEALFNAYVARDGLAAAETYSARPGHSEHQLGLAADLGDGSGCNFYACFGTTRTGQWLRANAHRYGFILRYDQWQQPVVGFIYEPWHFRYVGVAVASDMRARGFTNLEDYFQLPAAPSY